MTSEASDRTRLTIELTDDIEDVDTAKIAKRLRTKHGLHVTEVLAERVTRDH